MSHDAVPSAHPIIVFDGQCVLCSANAQFVLRHDRRGHFRLASMQGEVGAALYRRFGIDPADPESMIVVDGERGSIATATRSSQFMRDLAGRGARLPVSDVWCRGFLRDPVYRWIARHRYRLFGRREVCWVPSAEYAERVL